MFALAVTDINDCVTTVHEEVLNYKNDSAMQYLILRLYCLIFSFLIKRYEVVYGQEAEEVAAQLEREHLQQVSATASADTKLVRVDPQENFEP